MSGYRGKLAINVWGLSIGFHTQNDTNTGRQRWDYIEVHHQIRWQRIHDRRCRGR